MEGALAVPSKGRGQAADVTFPAWPVTDSGRNSIQRPIRRWKNPLLTLQTQTSRPNLSTGGAALGLNLEAATARTESFLYHTATNSRRQLECRGSSLQFGIQTWGVTYEHTQPSRVSLHISPVCPPSKQVRAELSPRSNGVQFSPFLENTAASLLSSTIKPMSNYSATNAATNHMRPSLTSPSMHPHNHLPSIKRASEKPLNTRSLVERMHGGAGSRVGSSSASMGHAADHRSTCEGTTGGKGALTQGIH